MTNWRGLYKSQGVYESEEIDISSDFNYYIVNKIIDSKNNDGIVDVQIRASFFDDEWTEWLSIIDDVEISIFYNEGVKLNNTKFQYRVILDIDINKGFTSPEFNSIQLIFNGAYKILNTGDIDNKPEVWIKKLQNSGDIKLYNETTSKILELKNLNKEETVYIDNENKDIMTDLPLKSRYKDHNREWLTLKTGENIITGEGNFELVVRHEFKTLQG